MTSDIFRRATLQGVVDYLIFGFPSETDTRDYETRLDEEYQKIEQLLSDCDQDRRIEFLDAVNEMASETASVYAEIGFVAGLLLIGDIQRHLG